MHKSFAIPCWIAVLCAPSTLGSTCYDIEWIQPPPCAFGLIPTIRAWGLNDAGTVAGGTRGCESLQPDRPFLYSNGQFTWLPTGGALRAEALAVNNLALAVGDVDVVSGNGVFEVPALFAPTPVLLPLPLGMNWGYAYAINDVLDIAGYHGNGLTGPGLLAALWRSGQFVDISADLPGPRSVASDVNAAGVVVGWTGSESSGIGARGFIWDDGQVTILPPVPAEDGLDNSSAFAINANGTVLVQGTASAGGVVFRTYLWAEGKYSPMLGWPESWTQSRGYDLNDNGEVVGVIRNHPEGTLTRAAVLRDGVMQELNMLLAPGQPTGNLLHASAINNSGQIAGWGTKEGKSAAFLLTPRLLPADLTGDCHVNGLDVAVLLKSWGPVATKDIAPAADINRDGIVNGLDLGLLLGAWG